MTKAELTLMLKPLILLLENGKHAEVLQIMKEVIEESKK